ncbi:hypothetical protein VE04_05042 [Pseudogymnoascus sp. 24MN13]|nr:hypothetical protein VE04_05042 [Pseudogymnoascus sp. 24MN13]
MATDKIELQRLPSSMPNSIEDGDTNSSLHAPQEQSPIPHTKGSIGDWIVALIYCLIVTGLIITIICDVRDVFGSKTTERYGMVSVMEQKCDSFPWRLNLITVAVNIAATVVVMASDHIREGLIAPSPESFLKQKGELRSLGTQSWTNFCAAVWYKRVFVVVLWLSSLPIHFLGNSIFFIKSSAYNVYEVLVSPSFFDGQSANITSLNMLRYETPETPTSAALDAVWPRDYTGVDELQKSLDKLQTKPSLWRNLTRNACIEEYNSEYYHELKTLVMVTNTTTPEWNNSALGIGILPGYRITAVGSSLIALCPDIYLATNNMSRKPDTAPYIRKTPQALSEEMWYCDLIPDAMNTTYKAHNCYVGYIEGAASGEFDHKIRPRSIGQAGVGIGDKVWYLKSVFFYNALHIFYAILFYLLKNWVCTWVARAESKRKNPTPKPGLWAKTTAYFTDMSTWVSWIMGLQALLMHLTIASVFLMRFLDVMPLGAILFVEEAAKPTLLFSSGISSFNNLTRFNESLVYFFFLLAVFFAAPYLVFFGWWVALVTYTKRCSSRKV